MAIVKSLLSLACALLYLQVSDAQIVIKPGDCPTVVGQSTLETSRYLGTWYEYQRFPAVFELGLECTTAQYGLAANGTINVTNAVFELGLECTTAQYGLAANGTISVTNKGQLRITVFNTKYVVKNSVANGKATVPDPSKPAELSVSFGGFAPPGGKANYIIQETDYENYSVIFSCTQLPGFNVQNAWILTRERGVAPSNLADLESRLSNAGVDLNSFFVVDQSECTA
ncbi:hypothetical protein EGW08_010955 [Elysia chlorotica]|uniref:Apolipoprotein D n=1 Tax=Elysia chlorotica TaxID=188477 RepID=A0A3S1BI58_ELYCH|nr:hypothetical protein EGW08_010955 [Elysia chlorotica]